MGLQRRVISVDYTEEDIALIEKQKEEMEVVDEVVVEDPPPSATSQAVGSSTGQVTSGVSYANTTSTSGGVGTQSYPITTRSGYRYTPSALPVPIQRGMSICVTGRFFVTRTRLVQEFMRPLGLYFDNNANYARMLVVARTSGTGKMRDALRSRRPIYSERDFLQALAVFARDEGQEQIARQLELAALNALTAIDMEAYLRGV